MQQIARLLDFSRWKYLLEGIVGRLKSGRHCPNCGLDGPQIDRKHFHTLHECANCGLVFRHPRESTKDAASFYESGYDEPGLTTDLPTNEELAAMIHGNFKGTSKDFGFVVECFELAGVMPGARILDYGANWGYGTYQFRRAGFEACAFEVSTRRAQFGQKLGLKIATKLHDIKGDFDVVYSCHVLEHVQNPAAALREQLSRVRPGGLVIGHTPNGGSACRTANPHAFHRIWGRAHPVLLTPSFLKSCFPNRPIYIETHDRSTTLAQWDRRANFVGDTSRQHLFFVIAR